MIAAQGTHSWITDIFITDTSRVRFPMVSLEFFTDMEFVIDIILPAALWPWG
jgi:hypothetical protein